MANPAVPIPGGGGFNAGTLVMAAAGLVSLATVLAAPSGAGVVVSLTNTLVVMPCLGDPIGPGLTAFSLNDVSSQATEWSTQLDRQAALFDASWSGEGADAFQTFWSTTMSPVLPALGGLAGAMAGTEAALGAAVLAMDIGAIKSYVTLISALVAAIAAAPATLGTSLALQWGAVGVWAAWAAGALALAITGFQTLSTVFFSVNEKASALKGAIRDAGSIGTNPLETNLNLPPLSSDINELSDITAQYDPKR